MAVPSDSDVKGYAHNAIIELFRQVVVVQGAVKSAESAYASQNFTDLTAALDETNDQLAAAINVS